MKGILNGIDCCYWSMLLLSVAEAVPVSWNSSYAKTDDLNLKTTDDVTVSSADVTTINSNNNKVCLYEGVEYNQGQSRPSKNPCEICTCNDVDFKCTIQTCVVKPGCKALHSAGKCCPHYVCDCQRNGRTYGNGEKVEEPNPCNVCYCRGGEVICTGVTCYTRDDCEPHYVPGKCCPKYDHCPAVEMKDRAPITPIFTEIQENSGNSAPNLDQSTEDSAETNRNQTQAAFATVSHNDQVEISTEIGITENLQSQQQVGTLEIIEVYPDQEHQISQGGQETKTVDEGLVENGKRTAAKDKDNEKSPGAETGGKPNDAEIPDLPAKETSETENKTIITISEIILSDNTTQQDIFPTETSNQRMATVAETYGNTAMGEEHPLQKVEEFDEEEITTWAGTNPPSISSGGLITSETEEFSTESVLNETQPEFSDGSLDFKKFTDEGTTTEATKNFTNYLEKEMALNTTTNLSQETASEFTSIFNENSSQLKKSQENLGDNKVLELGIFTTDINEAILSTLAEDKYSQEVTSNEYDESILTESPTSLYKETPTANTNYFHENSSMNESTEEAISNVDDEVMDLERSTTGFYKEVLTLITNPFDENSTANYREDTSNVDKIFLGSTDSNKVSSSTETNIDENLTISQEITEIIQNDTEINNMDDIFSYSEENATESYVTQVSLDFTSSKNTETSDRAKTFQNLGKGNYTEVPDTKTSENQNTNKFETIEEFTESIPAETSVNEYESWISTDATSEQNESFTGYTFHSDTVTTGVFSENDATKNTLIKNRILDRVETTELLHTTEDMEKMTTQFITNITLNVSDTEKPHEDDTEMTTTQLSVDKKSIVTVEFLKTESYDEFNQAFLNSTIQLSKLSPSNFLNENGTTEEALARLKEASNLINLYEVSTQTYFPTTATTKLSNVFEENQTEVWNVIEASTEEVSQETEVSSTGKQLLSSTTVHLQLQQNNGEVGSTMFQVPTDYMSMTESTLVTKENPTVIFETFTIDPTEGFPMKTKRKIDEVDYSLAYLEFLSTTHGYEATQLFSEESTAFFEASDEHNKTKNITIPDITLSYEINGNDNQSSEEDENREHTLPEVIGNYPKSQTPEKILAGTTTEMSSAENFPAMKKVENSSVTLAELLLRWLQSRRTKADVRKSEVVRTTASSITGTSGTEEFFDQKNEGRSGTPVSFLSVLSSEILKFIDKIPENTSLTNSTDGEERKLLTKDNSRKNKARSLQLLEDQNVEFSSKEIKNFPGILSEDGLIKKSTDAQEVVQSENLRYTDEHLAPVLSMISDQLQYLKVGEEQPLYMESAPSEDSESQKGQIVVPASTPTTVNMVKVIRQKIGSGEKT